MNKKRFRVAAGILLVLAAGLFHMMNLRDTVTQTGDQLPLKLYAVLLPAMLAGCAGAGVLFSGRFSGAEGAASLRAVSLSRCYMAAGLFLGLSFLAAMPGLSAPDEVSHYITAYRLSSRILGQPELTGAGRIAVRAEDYPLEDLHGGKTPEIPDDVEEPAAVLGNPVQNQTFRAVRDWTARYGARGADPVSSGLADVRTTPVMYLPQALGMVLVRCAGGNALQLIFAAKLLNLLTFLLLTGAAIRLLPFGKELLFGVGLLPMTLHLGSSMSYDAGIMGCAFLLTAKLFSLAFPGTAPDSVRCGGAAGLAAPSGKRGVGPKDLLLIFLLAAALGPCKMVYSLLIFLFLLIPSERFFPETKEAGNAGGRKAGTFALLLFVTAAAIAAVNFSIIRGYAGAARAAAGTAGTLSETTGQLITEDAVVTAEGEVLRSGYTVSGLLRSPFLIVRLLCNTFSLQGDEICGGVVGAALGNLDPLLGVPFFAAVIYWAGLLLMAVSAPEASPEAKHQSMGLRERLWCGCIVLGILLLTAGAMLVSWTSRDANIIEGIQGRYFLPVLPLFLLILPKMRRTKEDRSSIASMILYAFFCLDCYTVLRIFTLACMRV